ncbi:hypothetical protein ASD21_15855 [Caulobacter sp. Root1455]|nr:hypothetical protein ASD38_16755 [Caulobacter sp. Root487D2Y]KQY91784.1 hypothetical protein ASD21_15855 [Caulobacter sp. Root1455]
MTSQLQHPVADEAPWSQTLTDYDQRHLVTYLRLLDADQDGADWREASLLILGRDARQAPDLSRRCWETHLERARWMTRAGYRHLLALKP